MSMIYQLWLIGFLFGLGRILELIVCVCVCVCDFYLFFLNLWIFYQGQPVFATKLKQKTKKVP